MVVIAPVVLSAVIIGRAANQPESYLTWIAFAALLVSGVSTVLQAVRLGRIGAGHVLIMGTSGAFIAVCITAVAEGGPALMAILVLIASIVPILLSARLSLFQRILTPSVSGTVVMLIPVTVMPAVFDLLSAVPAETPTLAAALSALVVVLVIAGIALKMAGA